MCDDNTLEEMRAYRRRQALTRREFGALGLGVGLATLLPHAAAATVTAADVDIRMGEGTCDAYFVHPDRGVHPGVLMWPDIFGLRPAFRQMARRLAEAGYAVLVVNPFYRTEKAPPSAEPASPASHDKRMHANNFTPEQEFTDAKALLGWLDSQPAVDKGRKLGTLGYCMSGPFTLRTAAAVPERVGAGASFHGGGLVTDRPDSPHLLVPKLRARFLFAIAESDDRKEPQTKTVLREAFANAKLPAEIEVYPGTVHGWCPTDSDGYNPEQAEHAWQRLLAVFGAALG
ncbi:MAG: dienelactone hydrolase family protein [Gammaproteobacteria bacterium]|nr:dienelactone hydrolase family protein [Gammaproteobacteria bacterium]MBV9620791.1 dienelactone hydrolase family protein [Gammaproteobacteria bacterium]